MDSENSKAIGLAVGKVIAETLCTQEKPRLR